jgi:hypothetical protein
MIANFDNFIKDGNYYHGLIGGLWGDLRSTSPLRKNIQKYFFEKYPRKVNILNSSGSINSITLGILIKFANKRKDEELLRLIQVFLDRVEEIRIEKEAKKYNI